ncbi:MAG: PQQ-binding-like beta-propeller repeat protein [Anaerolineae bacterium]
MPIETQHLEDFGEDQTLGEQILPKGAILQNRYEILRILGTGGMGFVYLSRDLNFAKAKRFCAIKEMISNTHDPNFRRLSLSNFEREANTLASIEHPAIVKIYDYFTEGNRTYLVMQYIQGKNLEEIVNQLPENQFIEEKRVLDWGIQICDVLTFLHSNETPIVYRDLKPPNLILKQSRDGSERIILIDFGIAKAFQEGQKGTMMGTEGYSPPEQYRGIASPQGDVYALGATLHHMITRRDPKLEPPFTFHEALPRMFNPDLSELTEQIIMRALSYEAKDRFATASEMKLALQNALSAISGTGREPLDPRLQGAHPPQANQSAAASTNLLQTASPTAAVQPGSADGPTMGAPEAVTPQSGVIPVWSFKCEDEIRSSPTLGDDLVYIGAYDNNLYALDAKSGEFRWKYATEGGIASTPCFYKDKVIFGSEDRLIYAVTSHRGKLLWTCPTEGRVRSSVSVEFEHAFVGSDDSRLYAVNAQTGRVIWKFEAGGPIRSTPAIDGEIVYAGSEDGHLYAVNLQTGKMKWKFRANRAITSSPVVYEDLVLFGSADWNFYALNKASSWSIWRTRTNQAVISSPRIHNNIVYFGSVDGNLYALDAKSGKTIWKFKAESHIVSKPAVSDEAVFFGTSQGEVISIFVKSGKERWRFQTGGPVPSSPLLGDGIVYIGSTDHHLYALPA